MAMKKIAKVLLIVLTISLCFSLLAACSKTECDKNGHKWVNGVCTVCNAEYELVDYVAQCTLDMNSRTMKYTAANFIHMYIDGDTTHFKVPVSTAHPEGVLKARYMAVNTPESTGQVEPYGKVASNYTKAKLSKAAAVLVEADEDDGVWHNDSYGRTTAWVWYKETADGEWRNLNLELLQVGLGYGSDAGSNRYGEYCLSALNQAMQAKLIVHSGEPDELYYYGAAKEITVKELRTNFTSYEGVKVAFDGYVVNTHSTSSGTTYYVQAFDEEDDMYYGISVFYNGSIGKIKTALTKGNHVRVVGTATDFNGTWQVSGLTYNLVNSKDPNNTVKIDDDELTTVEPVLLTIPQFNSNKTVNAYDAESGDTIPKTFKLHQLMVSTGIKMVDLYVDHTYTTDSGTSMGAISMYCVDVGGNEITVRTEVLYKIDPATGLNVIASASEFEGQWITVIGVVDWYNYNGHNEYQIRVLNYADITVVG